MKITRNFTQIPNTIIFDKRLTPPEKVILMAILSYDFGTDKIFPSQGNIANKLKISRRTVNEHVRSLIKKEYIYVKKRGYSMSNMYFIREEKFSDTEKTNEDNGISNEKNISYQLRTKLPTKNTEVNNTHNNMIKDKDYRRVREKFNEEREKLTFLNHNILTK